MENLYPARSPVTASRVVDGEAVIIQPEKGLVSVLNGVGSRIWELSDGTRALEEIARVVAAEYQVDPDDVRTDAEEFVANLVQQGMLIAWEDSRGGS